MYPSSGQKSFSVRVKTTFRSVGSGSPDVPGAGSPVRGPAAASSRTHSSTRLSGRNRTKTGWRRRLSGVHSLNRTSTTTVGSTHEVPFDFGTFPPQGGDGRFPASSVLAISSSCRTVKPVPTLPA